MKYSLALCAALTLFSTQSYAHVTTNPKEGAAGSYFQTSFRISHGCDGADTTQIHVSIPPGFVTMKPQAKPGWTVEIKKRKLDKPVSAGHGKMATEEFSEIIWSGGKLSDSHYDEFGILTKLPETARKVYFPVVQKCGDKENRWTEIPAENQEWHDLKSPAPFVDIKDKHSAHSH